MTTFDFENLDLYKKTMFFIDMVYDLTAKFPKSELLGLSSQFTRAANSIALNLGEGFGETVALSLRYLRISRGSIRECVVCLEIAHRRCYISDEESVIARSLLVELSKMSMGYKKYLEKKKVSK
ncbi:four helix bundle protein [Ancylomarina euxinus]|uniref:Four helix bundle protein n=1 Tax=Ancylomarina euxinus TaxID=2283627 RepID=A0A425XYA6_9BACT|nr:four helix bundle protein [Ancylomarina euxinus]MCZ4695988.1 four helix bundle protein [Ancylomarina euxinus]MUP16360.1 four helix bundle protein [Ancylomarina euxinus]RRG19752.1 four helix bundle protein [Ancylomarina euxinus]